MRKLAGAVVLVGSILFVASAAPASNTSDKGHGAIEVYVSGSPKWRSMDINGTAGADRLRIDRKPGRGPYVIKANLPVVSTGGLASKSRAGCWSVGCPTADITASASSLAAGATVW